MEVVAPAHRYETLETPDSAGLQVVHDTRDEQAPEVISVDKGNHEFKKFGPAPAYEDTRKQPFWRKKRVWITSIVLLILICIGAVVGGVVGSRSGNDKKDATEDSSEDDQTSGTPTSTAAPSPTPSSIQPGSMLAAATWRDNTKQLDFNYLAYQNANGTFQIAQYVKSSSSRDGSWEYPRVVAPEDTPKDLSGLSLGLLRVQSSIYMDLTFVKESGALDGAVFDTGPQWRDYNTAMVQDLRKEINPGSALASLSGITAFQETSGKLTLRLRTATEEEKGWATRDLPKGAPEALKNTKLAIVPMSATHTKIYGDLMIGIIYQDTNGKLVAVPYQSGDSENESSWPSKFPDIELPSGGSFSAFSVQRSGDLDNEMVNTFIVYQDKSSVMKMIWTNDSKEWKTSTPEGLKGADKGTSISCTSPGTFNLPDYRRLPGGSELTRCYFFEDGKPVSVQLDRGEWVRKEAVRLP